MNQDKIIQLKQGLSTAFINQNNSSNLAYKPQFVSNNYKEGRKVISSIEDELLSCEEFAIIRRYVTEGGRVIPGASTIHFDEVSRKRIFQAIDNANFSDVKLIRENYANLKNKLGHIPALSDFDKYGEMDVLRIFDNSSLGSYYKFKKSIR